MHVTLGDWAKEVGHDLHRMNNCAVLLIQWLRGRILHGKHALKFVTNLLWGQGKDMQVAAQKGVVHVIMAHYTDV